MTLRMVFTRLLQGGLLLLLTFALLTLLLMLFPRMVFGQTDYYQRMHAGQSMPVQFKNIDGDLFVALPGRIRPPSEEVVLQDFTIAWDADGFRVAAQQAPTYPIAVFGDSFTEGYNVPYPWPDILASETRTPVYNYGYRAYGPREVARAAEEFAAEQPRNWVIYGYFAGNDLGDAVRAPKVDTGSPLGVWSALVKQVTDPPVARPADPTQTRFDAPSPVIIGGNYYELVFISYYLWWQLAPPEGFEVSRNFAILRESLARIDASVPEGSCRALAFIPTKEQLYYLYIHPGERQWLRGVGHSMTLGPNDELRMVPQPIAEADEADFLQALYGQRDAVAALVQSLPGWSFFDLLPVFETAVAQGELLYYPYDSHWNQEGHQLAGRALAEMIRAHPECGSTPVLNIGDPATSGP